MIVKDIWSHEDFDEMGWHDSRLYSLHFPNDDLKLILSIDYIFEWVKHEGSIHKFWVSPCDLVFLNVLNITLNIDFEDYTDIYIESIERINKGKAPKGDEDLWEYNIYLDKGSIKFNSTGYVQVVKAQPILSESQCL